MTYRERRGARADRLREWAARREAKSNAAYEGARRIADGIPLGQPILIGHHSEKHHRRDLERIDNGMRASVEHSKMAESMTSRADNIESAADRAIYSDDHDAPERLAERVATLEATRDRYKAVNAIIRKALRGLTVYADKEAALITLARDGQITARECAELSSTMRCFPGMYEGTTGLPGYSFQLTNLNGNIARNRKRLTEVTAPRRARSIYARRAGTCGDCREAINPGEVITETEPSEWVHGRCHEARKAASENR